MAKSMDKNETPYLMVRVDRLCVESAVTTYGLVLQAALGGVQVVDKIHTGTSGEYLEMLSSGDDRDLISVVYRKVWENIYENQDLSKNKIYHYQT